MKDQLNTLIQRAHDIEKSSHDLRQAIKDLEMTKTKLTAEVEIERNNNCKLATKLQQVTGVQMHLEQLHEANTSRVQSLEHEQRETYLALLESERSAAETNIAAHVESCRYTEQMIELNKAYIQSRRDFWSKIHQSTLSPADNDFDETDV